MKLSDVEQLEEIAANERKRIEREEEERYQAGPHTPFEIGDWVTDGERVGKIQAIFDLKIGRINVHIVNKNGGCLCGGKARDWDYLDDETRDYYTTEQEMTVRLTGEDIEACFMSYLGLRNVNPSKTKDKLIDALQKLRIEVDVEP